MTQSCCSDEGFDEGCSVSGSASGSARSEWAHLNRLTKVALPMVGAPNVMQRVSAVGHRSAAHVAARLAKAPPRQCPVQRILRGRSPPAVDHNTRRFTIACNGACPVRLIKLLMTRAFLCGHRPLFSAWTQSEGYREALHTGTEAV